MDNQVFDLIVYAHPVAQGRPRARYIQPNWSGKKPFVSMYDPPKSRDWKKMINGRAQQAVLDKDFKMFEKGIALVASIEIVIDRPRSVSVKRRPYPTGKPDLKNYIAGIEDAIEGVVYYNDSHIVTYVPPTLKRYADMDEQPFIRVIIMPYEDWLNERARIGTGGATTDAGGQVSDLAREESGEAVQSSGEVR